MGVSMTISGGAAARRNAAVNSARMGRRVIGVLNHSIPGAGKYTAAHRRRLALSTISEVLARRTCVIVSPGTASEFRRPRLTSLSFLSQQLRIGLSGDDPERRSNVNVQTR